MKISWMNCLPLAAFVGLLGVSHSQVAPAAPTPAPAAAPAAAPADTTAKDTAAVVAPPPAAPEAEKAKVDATEKVIVVGYGALKKRDVTGSVAIVDSKDLKKSGQSDVTRALQGRAAGVNIVANSGQPGKSMQVRVRGIGSTNSSDPLYVVDGMPTTNIDFLNPLDIETITVLKDASSTSIYGSRAANGVVLITTKQGVAGKSQVHVNATYGVSEPWKKPSFVSSNQYAQLRKEAFANANAARDSANQITPEPILDTVIANPAYPTTDWFGAVTRSNAVKKTLDFSMDQGDKSLKFFFSGGYSSEEGIVRRSDAEKATVRANVVSKVKKWLTVGENMSFAHTKVNAADETDEWNSNLITAITADPITPARDANGNLAPKAIKSGIKNPIGVMERDNDLTDANRFNGNAYMEISPIENLTFRTSYGLDARHADSTVFNPSYRVEAGDENANNSLIRRYNRDVHWSWENTINYGLNIGEDQFLKFLVGGTAEEDNSDYIRVSNSKMPSNDPTQRYLSAATGTPSAQGNEVNSAQLSALARVNYDIAYRYFLNGSFRADGSSKFGPDNRWGYFPSLGAAWDISKESFMKDVTWMDLLKLRFGWGIIGNQSIPDYLYATTTKVNQNYVLNGEVVKGVAFVSAGNPDIHWEGQESYNIGFDFQLFNKSIDFTSDFYIKKTTDMLLEENVPAQSGIQVPTIINGGEMENKGIDLALTYQKEFGAFFTKVTGTYSMYRNEVTKMENPRNDVNFRNMGTVNRTEKGHPIALFYGKMTNGLYQAGDSIPDGLAPGDIKYVKTADGSGDSIGFIGSPHPDFTYGANFDFGYKTAFGDFDMNLFFQGTQGNKIYNGVRYYTDNNTGLFNMDTRMMGRWTPTNPNNDATLPRMNADDANNITISDRYVEDGSYLRLKSLSVGYSLPSAWLKTVGIGGLRIYAGASNLLTFTGYKGLDPEVGLGRYSTSSETPTDGNPAGTLDLGIDRGVYPQARTYYTGIDLSI